jgi:hypothetical protein
MPARKNNPKKFGYVGSYEQRKNNQKRDQLIGYIIRMERERPGIHHAPPAQFDDLADELCIEGFLTKSKFNRTYVITHKFWMKYISPTR